jgi:hypothetical protein
VKGRVFLSRVVKVSLLLLLLGAAGEVAAYVQSTSSWHTIHWHFTLSISIYGQQATIPTGVGIHPDLWKYHALDAYATNPGSAPMHTHDDTGLIHIEATGPPINYTLGDFFAIWGLPFNDTCLSNVCVSNSTVINMFVNGEQNYDFGNYIPHDHDVISIQVGPPSQLQQMPGIQYDPILCDELLICA